MKLILAMALTALCCSGVAQAQPVKLGAGTYFLSPQSGDPAMPRAPWRTEAMLKQAAPTSQWYSSLIFNEKPDAIFVQPITTSSTACKRSDVNHSRTTGANLFQLVIFSRS